MLKSSAQSSIVSREHQQGVRPTTMNSDQEEDDSSYDDFNDFNELLQSEVHVDLDRLRILARQGVPTLLRGKVWKFFLGVEQADRSKELTSKNARVDKYKQIEKSVPDPDIAKRIRGEIGRYQARTPELFGQNYTDLFERIIIAYLNTNREVEYYPALVTMAAPFIYGLDEECDAYFCFERLMQDIGEYDINNSIKERMASFMTLFRYSLPELCTYFDDEEVDLKQWATSWLEHLLSKEMKFENLVRLWDYYFSIPDPLDLHPFVCLAILRHIHEQLEDLEQSEIKTTLQRLPLMDMQRILAGAVNLRNETIEREMSQTELYRKSSSPMKQNDGAFPPSVRTIDNWEMELDKRSDRQ